MRMSINAGEPWQPWPDLNAIPFTQKGGGGGNFGLGLCSLTCKQGPAEDIELLVLKAFAGVLGADGPTC